MRERPSFVSYCTRSTFVFCNYGLALSASGDGIRAATARKCRVPLRATEVTRKCSIVSFDADLQQKIPATITLSAAAWTPLLFRSGNVSRQASTVAEASPSCSRFTRKAAALCGVPSIKRRWPRPRRSIAGHHAGYISVCEQDQWSLDESATAARRRPRGNRGNNTGRLCTGERHTETGKRSSTSHRYIAIFRLVALRARE